MTNYVYLIERHAKRTKSLTGKFENGFDTIEYSYEKYLGKYMLRYSVYLTGVYLRGEMYKKIDTSCIKNKLPF